VRSRRTPGSLDEPWHSGWISDTLRYVKTELPPGPRTPRSLQTLRWIVRPTAYMEECRRRYGDSFTLRIANEGSWVFLTDPEAVKQVFTGDPRLLHAGEANVVLLPVLGSHSVLLLDDAAHMRQRKLMLPPFHGDRLRGYADTMREVTEEAIRSWPLGAPLATRPLMQALTLEIIMRTVFGVQDEARKARLRSALSELLRWGSDPRRVAIGIALGPQLTIRLGLFRSVLQPADDAIYEEIAAHRAAGGLEDRDDVMSLLLQARHDDGSPMSDEELRDELMTLLTAGHETTATGLAWALERLVRHPDALERLRAGDDEYADAVAKETLRLRSPISLVLRRLQEPMEIGGRLLPAGVNVVPCIYLMHRRADVYPDPLAFRPERFLEGQGGTYTWIPFGGGVRRCLGASFAQLEMRIVLQALARRFELSAADPRPELMVRRAIISSPSRDGEIVARARTAAPSETAALAA
jgi:cytochrome P450 family 135